MYTYIIVLLFVCNTLAYYEYDENSLNVGTVLFTSSDVEKRKWTQKEIALLRARKYFQNLIPPPHFLRTADEHYVDELLKYFQETFISIKRDAIDRESDQIMTTALSDTIGGYLKEWVLPITKYAFYGGTVSQDSVVKIFNFYEDIKDYLATDGQGWRQPHQNLLTSMTINVAPTKQFTERNMENACEKLAYFEQTPSGLSVPMPYVNWNGESSTMFVPLKNLSLISLNLPSSTVNPLIVYYNVAKRCTESISLKEENEFDGKFNIWLCRDVIPHLKDDNVYLGLGNVLSLLDNIKKVCHNFDEIVEVKPPFCRVKRISKKMIIVITLLFIEAAWCIPALLLLLRKKMKKNKYNNSKGNNTTRSFDTNSKWTNTAKVKTSHQTSNTKSVFDTDSKWTNTAENNVTVASSSISDYNNIAKTGIKLSKNKPHLRNVALETNVSMFVAKNSIGTGSQILNYSSKMCSTSVVNIINESPLTHVKSSLKKICSKDKVIKNLAQDKPIMHSSVEFSGAQPECDRRCCPKSISSIQEKKQHKNTTAVQESKKKDVSGEIGGSQIDDNKKVKSRCECLPCIKKAPIIDQIAVVKHVKLQHKQTAGTARTADTAAKPKATKLRFQREIYCKGGKLKPDKPYVEVTIDRPQKEITVGHGTNIKPAELNKSLKPSRIPKLAPKGPNSVDKPPTPRKFSTQASVYNRKSHIPQLAKRATDDLSIKEPKVSKNDKLNVTL